MFHKSLLSVGVLTSLLTTIFAAAAQPVRDTQISAIRLTIAETVLATNSQLSDRPGLLLKEMNWHAELNDRSWSLTMTGFAETGRIEIFFGGFLWGSDTEDWIATYAGAGQIAGEPIEINGKLDWPFDKPSSDRLKANFKQVAKFGKNSTWAWIVGTEVIVGGVLGGGAAVIVSAAAPPATILLGLAGASTGASAAVTVSNAVRSAIDADKPTAPPAPPPEPSPGKDERLLPKDGILYAAVARDGNVVGSGPAANYVLNGIAQVGYMSGRLTRQ